MEQGSHTHVRRKHATTLGPVERRWGWRMRAARAGTRQRLAMMEGDGRRPGGPRAIAFSAMGPPSHPRATEAAPRGLANAPGCLLDV